VPQEVHTDDGKVDGSEEKGPLELAAVKGEIQAALAQTRNPLAGRSSEVRAGRKRS
jgi:hypothetical protein